MCSEKCTSSTSVPPQIALSHFSTRPRSQESRFCPLPVLMVASMHVHVGYIEWERWTFCFSVHVQLRASRIIALRSLACWGALVALSTSLSGLAYPRRTVSINGGGGAGAHLFQSPPSCSSWVCFSQLRSVCITSEKKVQRNRRSLRISDEEGFHLECGSVSFEEAKTHKP